MPIKLEGLRGRPAAAAEHACGLELAVQNDRNAHVQREPQKADVSSIVHAREIGHSRITIS